ncbi:hypothetical protein ACROYT_G015257 [Oculina patagonica]
MNRRLRIKRFQNESLKDRCEDLFEELQQLKDAKKEVEDNLDILELLQTNRDLIRSQEEALYMIHWQIIDCCPSFSWQELQQTCSRMMSKSQEATDQLSADASKATMDRLSKFKITCSTVKICSKFDVLGENHGEEIMDLKQKICEAEQLVEEKEKGVVTLVELCSSPGHACTNQCTEDTKKAKVSCRQNDTNNEDLILHVMQPTVSSTRMVVGDIISGSTCTFSIPKNPKDDTMYFEEVHRAVEDAGHAAQAVRVQRSYSRPSKKQLTNCQIMQANCRQNDTNNEDLILHVMQPTVSSTRMVVGDIISGNNGRFIEEVRRAVEDAGHAAQAVRAQSRLITFYFGFLSAREASRVVMIPFPKLVQSNSLSQQVEKEEKLQRSLKYASSAVGVVISLAAKLPVDDKAAVTDTITRVKSISGKNVHHRSYRITHHRCYLGQREYCTARELITESKMASACDPFNFDNDNNVGSQVPDFNSSFMEQFRESSDEKEFVGFTREDIFLSGSSRVRSFHLNQRQKGVADKENEDPAEHPKLTKKTKRDPFKLFVGQSCKPRVQERKPDKGHVEDVVRIRPTITPGQLQLETRRKFILQHLTLGIIPEPVSLDGCECHAKLYSEVEMTTYYPLIRKNVKLFSPAVTKGLDNNNLIGNRRNEITRDICSAIRIHTMYPTKAEREHVAFLSIRKYPFLKDVIGTGIVHCIAHKLELADTVKSIEELEEAKSMLQGIWKYYHYSAKAVRELKETMQVRAYKAVKADDTRWVPHLKGALEVLLLKNYYTVVTHLQHTSQARD